MSAEAAATFDIEALGVQGDGIARVEGAARFIAFALPGETVSVRPDGAVTVLAGVSGDRAVPPCPHFTACGGCMAQHMSPELYGRWKSDIVREAFVARGFAQPPVAPLIACATGSRRRAVLSAVRKGGAVSLGYHARRSHDLIDVTVCIVLDPGIVAAFPALRSVVAALGVAEARLSVLATPAGLDVAINTTQTRLTPGMSASIGNIAAEARWARVSLNDAPIVTRTLPYLDMGGVRITPPPGAFIQAVAQAEEAMRGLVLAAVGKPKRVADLFCWLGAFSFALSTRARVTAIDNDRPALAALDAAKRHAQGLKPIDTLARDLFRDPLSPLELKDFDAVVLDPPRAGAEAQAAALARSDVATIAYVSCNPTTLARDARLLVDGGYALESITPIDQFLYSTHVEAAAVFRKAGKKKRR